MVFTYYVMGCADTEDFAKAEYIAESLMQRLPKMKCEIYPKTKEEWPDAVQEICKRPGFKRVHPLIWTGSNYCVGGLIQFQREVESKYGIKFEGGHRWEALKSENMLHMKSKQAMARGDGPKSVLGASANGRDVADELLAGHERWRQGHTQMSKHTAGSVSNWLPILNSASLPAAEGVAAVVILINDLEAPATIAQMLDQPEEAIFVIPCKDAAMSEFVQGNAEYGLVKLGARVLWVIGCPSADFDLAFQQTKDALQMKEEPLWPDQAWSVSTTEGMECFSHRRHGVFQSLNHGVFQPPKRRVIGRLQPAIRRAVLRLPASMSEEKVREFALHECSRDAAHSIRKQSPVIDELARRGLVHIECLACAGAKSNFKLERV